MAKKKNAFKVNANALIIGLLVVVIIFQAYQITTLKSQISKGNIITGSTLEKTPATQLEEIKKEVLTEEGSATGYGLTFSNNGIKTLVGYASSIELSGDEQTRYVSIGNQPDTACEYCCGIGERGALTQDGRIACGCEHNIAITGLIRYLIKEGYSDEEILQEIQKWKSYFFPKDYLAEVLDERGVSPESVGLPVQRGAC